MTSVLALTRHKPHVAPPMAQLQSNAQRAARFLKLMANPKRLMVLCQLSAGEKSVGELERIVRLSQSALSQHLAVLRRAAVVKTRREGQTIFYSLASEEATLMMDALFEVFCQKPAKKAARPKKPRA